MVTDTKEKFVDELEGLLSGRQSLKSLSGIPKKCYKYTLVAIFINMLSGRQLTQGQEENFALLYQIKENPRAFNNNKVHEYIRKSVEYSLTAAGYKNPTSEKSINRIIELFRVIVQETKTNDAYLANVSVLEEILDVQVFYKKTNANKVQPHHWVHIDLLTGAIVTVPEFFTYGDLVNSWNLYVDKYNQQKRQLHYHRGPLIEVRNNQENRRLTYELGTLTRNLIISSVTFVESYLYYTFYNLKNSDFEVKTASAKSLLASDKAEDVQIIKQIILKEFIQTPSQEINGLITNYQAINKIRNRFIHTSAFTDNTNKSELLPLITISHEYLIDSLETCIELVQSIDTLLPDELKVLFWWDTVTHPCFRNLKKGDITNENSILTQIKYNED